MFDNQLLPSQCGVLRLSIPSLKSSGSSVWCCRALQEGQGEQEGREGREGREVSFQASIFSLISLKTLFDFKIALKFKRFLLAEVLMTYRYKLSEIYVFLQGKLANNRD